MNNWWKLALGGAAGAGLLAATGGLAAPALLGADGAAAAGAAGAGAADAGAAAAGGGLLAGDAAAGGAAAGAGAAGTAGAGAGTMAFVTPPVTEGSISAAGILGEAPVTEGMLPGAYSDVAGEQYAMAHPAPGLLAQAQGYAGQAGKAASTYGAVTRAMGGGQPQQQAPHGQPIFQGAAPQIAPQATPQTASPQQGLLAQSGGNAGGMLRAIAQQRFGKRY